MEQRSAQEANSCSANHEISCILQNAEISLLSSKESTRTTRPAHFILFCLEHPNNIKGEEKSMNNLGDFVLLGHDTAHMKDHKSTNWGKIISLSPRVHRV